MYFKNEQFFNGRKVYLLTSWATIGANKQSLIDETFVIYVW